MKTTAISTRRRFFSTAGVALSAPLAITAVAAKPDLEGETLALKTRLIALQDELALHALSNAYFKAIQSGQDSEVAALFENSADIRLINFNVALTESSAAEISDDGTAAVVSQPCSIAIATAIEAPESSLVAMARAQGEGVVLQAEERVMVLNCTKQANEWRIVTASLISSREDTV